MDSFKSSVFGQSLVSLCFKCFIHRLLRFSPTFKTIRKAFQTQRSQRLAIYFKPHKATFSHTSKGRKLSQNLYTVDENKKTLDAII